MNIEFKIGRGFEWENNRGDNLLVKYEFPDPAIKIDSEQNIVYELWANDHTESQIYPITFNGGNTCGWLFTVSAVTSKNLSEEIQSDKHFRSAAWAVTNYLVEKYKEKIEEISASTNRVEFTLDECIDSDLSLISIYRPQAPQVLQNNASSLVPKLIELGLTPFIANFSRKTLRPAFKIEARVLNISLDIPNHEFQDFYNDLLTRYIPSVDDLTFKFYLYYQIVESMMEDVLIETAKGVLADLTDAQGNVVAIRDSLEKYQKISSESTRIKKVFSMLAPEKSLALRNACEDFLDIVDSSFDRQKHVAEEAAFFLYKTRNQLIHNFRRSKNGETQLSDVVANLADLIPNLICQFRLTP
jgi:hypothetical protein